jgi:hypothetical protein
VSEGQAAAVAAVVPEWVEAVQQEAPGAVMGVVWTHDDALDASDMLRSADRAAGVALGADGAADAGSIWVLRPYSTAEGALSADGAADSGFGRLWIWLQ